MPEVTPSIPPKALFGTVDLVIFDFDGVIADSEVISLGSLREALATYGIALTLEEVRKRYLGSSLKKVEADLVVHGPRKTTEGFREFWHARLFERFRAELTPVPGLTDLLDRLDRRGTPFCIASSGSFERIGVALEAMSLTHRFAHVFSAELVANGKPAPDLFLHAAGEVGLRPERCLVIEDSPFGIMAAKAARMRTVGFIGGAHLRGIQHEHRRALLDMGANDVVGSLDEIMPVLADDAGASGYSDGGVG